MGREKPAGEGRRMEGKRIRGPGRMGQPQVAGVRRGEGALEGTGTGWGWGELLPCTCNNKLWAQGLTAGWRLSCSYSPQGSPWWLCARETPLRQPPLHPGAGHAGGPAAPHLPAWELVPPVFHSPQDPLSHEEPAFRIPWFPPVLF